MSQPEITTTLRFVLFAIGVALMLVAFFAPSRRDDARDIHLVRDAASVLVPRHPNPPQQTRIYHTYTDTANNGYYYHAADGLWHEVKDGKDLGPIDGVFPPTVAIPYRHQTEGR